MVRKKIKIKNGILKKVSYAYGCFYLVATKKKKSLTIYLSYEFQSIFIFSDKSLKP